MVEKKGNTNASAEATNKQFPVDAFVQFHEELKKQRTDLANTLAGDGSPAESDDAMKQRLAAGEKALLFPVRLPTDDALLAAAKGFLQVAAQHEVIDKSEAEAAAKAIADGGLDLSSLVKAVITHKPDKVETYVSSSKLQLDTLLFLGEQMGRSVLTWHASRLGDVLETVKNTRGNCPVCDHLPRLSTLSGEEGKRELICGMCENSWYYQRIGCPFCDNTEQSKLQHFTVDDDAQYQVDLCDSCKRYIKLVDLRKLQTEEVALTQLDAQSARLDVLAKREGYK